MTIDELIDAYPRLYHMAEFGYAIAGDPKYRCDRPTPNGLDQQLLLHARAIRLPHPAGGQLNVQAPLPQHLRDAFDLLGFNERDERDPYAPFEAAR